ncbi:PAS domain-containing protein [Deinococcus ruber]|uniref:PAS domain-containing protein n=1 Tax=Deinococcus ruber TaxID=1848197 RepID=A0A918FHJ0_9DEIO|nr:PAS domain-containing protein [Deinococcus ruber]GGR38155.1 hypothetical protein GCM10008957_54200 [Deinococcus ruber]
MNGSVTGVGAQDLFAGLELSVTGAVVADLRDDTFPVVYVNPACLTLTGYAADDLLGRPLQTLQDDDPAAERADFRRAVAARRAATLTVRCVRAGVGTFRAEVSLRPVPNTGGEPTHVVAFIQDVTELHRLRAALDQLPEAVMTFDRDWTMTYVNAAAAANAKRAADTLIGQLLLGAYPEVAGTPAFLAAQQALSSGLTQQVITYSERLSRALKTTAYPALGGVAVLLQDVTAEQALEHDLTTSQERFAKVFDASPLAIAITRLRDGQFVDANPAFTRLSG